MHMRPRHPSKRHSCVFFV